LHDSRAFQGFFVPTGMESRLVSTSSIAANEEGNPALSPFWPVSTLHGASDYIFSDLLQAVQEGSARHRIG